MRRIVGSYDTAYIDTHVAHVATECVQATLICIKRVNTITLNRAAGCNRAETMWRIIVAEAKCLVNMGAGYMWADPLFHSHAPHQLSGSER